MFFYRDKFADMDAVNIFFNDVLLARGVFYPHEFPNLKSFKSWLSIVLKDSSNNNLTLEGKQLLFKLKSYDTVEYPLDNNRDYGKFRDGFFVNEPSIHLHDKVRNVSSHNINSVLEEHSRKLSSNDSQLITIPRSLLNDIYETLTKIKKLNVNSENNNSEGLDKDLPVHTGVLCDGCHLYNPRSSEYLRGTRYKCLNCKEFNLCSHCNELNICNNIHSKDHHLLSFKKPTTNSTMSHVSDAFHHQLLSNVESPDFVNKLEHEHYMYEKWMNLMKANDETEITNVLKLYSNDNNNKCPSTKSDSTITTLLKSKPSLSGNIIHVEYLKKDFLIQLNLKNYTSTDIDNLKTLILKFTNPSATFTAPLDKLNFRSNGNNTNSININASAFPLNFGLVGDNGKLLTNTHFEIELYNNNDNLVFVGSSSGMNSCLLHGIPTKGIPNLGEWKEYDLLSDTDFSENLESF